MKKLTIGIDFDGTIVTHEYPHIGSPLPKALQTMKALRAKGHKIILFTMRSGKPLEEAVQYLVDNDITLFGVNENPTQGSWTSSVKPYCQIYIDDAALGCPLIFPVNGGRPYVNWGTVTQLLAEKGVEL